MEFKVETLPRYQIAYARRVGPYGPVNVQTMEEIKTWAEKSHLLNHSAILFGIPQDNPNTTPPENCRYDACIVISADEVQRVASPISMGELPGGDYMVFTIKHTTQDVQLAWAELLPTLHTRGYQIEDKPIMERYTGEMLRSEYCEICVPITSLK
ncbi:GyrI-like domain-containing protein [Paenibacillus sp. MBLB2552]|uniref:GyrI-like domain-containing protein n=1 Tax=Paenibacillus mellifer TaxID=2937794 RepID=A0A9X1XXC3_9BACL|nr:GyrI-like domain-containing protein [Paenibacillus mellifer]MCK8487735.1 GyrI-like domain-containing protein [Paenibacillus mellifer]